jgi:hypothetical protein
VIEDLDGATSEPSRRTHVAVLSAATAVFAIVLFYVLVAPPTFVGAPPQAASPSPSQSTVMTVASNLFIDLPVDLARSSMCPDGLRWGNPPFQLAVDANGGRALTPVIYDRTGSRPIAFVQEEHGTGRLIVTCAQPDGVMPRINRAR